MPRVPQAELRDAAAGESSARVRERVVAARIRQLARAGKPNAALGNAEIARDCALDARSHALLDRAIERLGLSARAYHRVLRVARTIADLGGHERLGAEHVSESILYRRLDLA
jgi:magnesium chelatase family protein